jgi:hypothetical protein
MNSPVSPNQTGGRGPGKFTSVIDLRRKLMRYMKQYNKTAKPVRWAYADPTRRLA